MTKAYGVVGKRGDFDPLIPEDVVYRVQAILAGRVYTTGAARHPQRRPSAGWLVPPFLALRKDVTGNVRHLTPLDVEAPAVAEQRSPNAVVYVNDDSETSSRIVVPFPDVGHPAEQHREAEPNHTLIEPLRAGPQPQATSLVHRKVDINREVLV